MINNFVGTGRTTKDIDLRYSSTGTAIANFTLAITRRFDKDKTDFLRCVAFKKTAELIAQYVKKGHQIGIEGSVQTGSYENGEGRTIYTTEIIVNNVQFLESKGGSQSNSNQQQNNQQSEHNQSNPFKNEGEPLDINDSDLPF